MHICAMITLIIGLLYAILIGTAYGRCPTRESSWCLQIDGFDTIVLDGNKFKDLDVFFDKISFLFEDNGETKELDQLMLINNHAIRSLERGAFRDFRFRRIVIQNCTHLSRFHVDAFNGTKEITKILKIDNIMIHEKFQEDFFEALNSLEHLEELELKSHRISKIRPYTFRQQNLQKLILSGPLEYLDKNAFFYLDDIKILVLTKSIRHVNAHAFDLKQANNKTLDIYLEAKVAQLDVGVFTYTNRPLNINLFLNRLQSFNFNVFQPVLMSPLKHEIIFHGDPREMQNPCVLIWLFRSEQKFKGVASFQKVSHISESYFDQWACAYEQPPQEGGGGSDSGNDLPSIDQINRAGIDAGHNGTSTAVFYSFAFIVATTLFSIIFQ